MSWAKIFYIYIKQTLEYTPPKNKPNHRIKNITWFNPPYNKSIMSNISKDFLNLISKHFPYHSPLIKIFDRKIKVSYIRSQQKNWNSQHHTCNYKDKESCLLQGNCIQKKLMYRATVRINNSVKQCIGAMEGILKPRIYARKLSFSNRSYSTNTSLSTHIWHQKDMNISHTISREILKL